MQNPNSFRVNKLCGTMPGLHNNVGLRFPERPPIHIARGHNLKKQRHHSDRHPAAEIKAQSNKMPQIITYSTDHQKIMQQMHSTEEEPCPQTRNTQTQTGLGKAALEKPQSTTEELVGAAPKAIPCECK
ncbi:hypothetical protein TcG_10083 [Trypanosoma cruzi]|nr:hypothetical protein TcG_10083 [Trypanosoma cruzi]